MNNEKKVIKAQIKKDKARLKELKKKDKQSFLTEAEMWEYATLLFQQSNRDWDVSIRCGTVALFLLALAGVVQVLGIVLMFVLY